MLHCALCDKPIRECCDIYVTATDTTTGEEAVLCGDCAAALEVDDDKEDAE